MTNEEADRIVELMRLGQADPFTVFQLFPQLIDNLRNRAVPLEDNNPRNPWPIVGLYCLARELIPLAGETYSTWYELQVDSEPPQPSAVRAVHKGTTLHQLGVVHLSEGRLSFAKRYFILAMIEDMWGAPDDFRNRQAYRVLRSNFLMTEDEVNHIFRVASAQEDRRFPEAALLAYQLETKGRTIRTIEREIHRINHRFARALMEAVRGERDATSAGKLFENLIVYIFSAVVGFEVGYYRAWARRGEFEYDIIVRNLITTDPVFTNFGPYFLVESKYWSEPVSVEAINHFIAKILGHDVKCGVLVAKEGVPKGPANQTIVRAYHRHGILVLVLTLEDIENVVEGRANLLVELLSEFERVRFDLTDRRDS